MAGLPPLETRDHGQTRQFHIADRVENLVTHELVGIALQGRVHQSIAIDHERVGEIRAPAEARRAQLLSLLEEAKGSRGGDLAAERLWVKCAGKFLPAD